MVYQHLKGWISYQDPSLTLTYWRTRSNVEVDFVVYGKDQFVALEVKNSIRIRSEDLSGLRAFGEDYPQAQLIFLHRGTQYETHYEKIQCIPVDDFLKNLTPGKPLANMSITPCN